MREPIMPESVDIRALWRDQPNEKLPVPSPDVLALRSRRLQTNMRTEILASVCAVLFLAGVLISHFGTDKTTVGIVALATVWVLITLHRLRRRVWWSRDDAVAASGVEFCRLELEHRRTHLSNTWLWHGPLLLACVAMVGVAISTGTLAYRRLPQVSPLLILLIVWIGFNVRQRRREVKAIQQELDEMAGQ